MLSATLVLLGAFALVVFAKTNDEPTGGALEGSIRPDVVPRNFRLVDENGTPTTLSQFRGKPVILTFMYSTCQDTCPLLASQIRQALDQLGSHAVPALAISVDPANDTQRNVKRFLVEHQVIGRIKFLRGTRAQLAPIWKEYGIQPQTKAFEHSAYTLVIDSRGRARVSFPHDQITPEALAHDVRELSGS